MPNVAPENLKLSAEACRNGRILTVKWQTTVSQGHDTALLSGVLNVLRRQRKHQSHAQKSPFPKNVIFQPLMPVVS